MRGSDTRASTEPCYCPSPTSGVLLNQIRSIERRDTPESVDSLHLRAGTTGLLELHGNLREARCERCGERRALDASGLPLDEIDHRCGGRMRPDIVWFGESLPQAVWKNAEAAAARAEVILVVGTSALVYPAAALATHYATNAYVAEINTEETSISARVDCVLRGTAAATLPRIVEAL